MASRPSRVSSIPIPMPPSNTRSIENAISIPSSRTRISSSSFATSPPSLTRSVPRSSSSSRTSVRLPYEPRVIRGAPAQPSEYCPPTLSAGQGRRASTSGYPGRPTPRMSSSSHADQPAVVLAPETFARPAYLDHSTFRDALHSELSFAIPRKDASTPAPAMTPSTTDSDDESSTPPRRVQAPSTPSLPANVFNLPTKWSVTDRSTHLTISQDGRDLTYASNGDKDGASARTDVPVPPACGTYYYEVEVRSKDTKAHVSIGFAGPRVKFNRLPGWESASWGYHGDDGNSFHSQREGNTYSQTYGNGDIVGCGIDFSTHRAFYTKNGHFLGNVFERVGSDIDLFPSVGLQHSGDSIRVNFGHEAFKFDIENHVQQQKTAAWNRIMATPLYTSILKPGTPASSAYPKGGGIRRRTVRAFQKHQDVVIRSKSAVSDDKDFDMAAASPIKESFTEDNLEDDIERRTRIVSAVVKGDIDLAISDTEKYHPTVLKAEASLMLFKLRCRKFVELILESAAMKKEMELAKDRDTPRTEPPFVTPVAVVPSIPPSTDGDWFEESMDMDVDDDGAGHNEVHAKHASCWLEPDSVRAGKQKADGFGGLVSTAQYEAALSAAIVYGQSLSDDYKGDTRSEVKQLVKQTFGILAWEDLLRVGGETAEFVSVEARVRLASELNQAILKSQGRPARPALETLYRHTSACITQLGALGEGAAAFADLRRELLDA
ncbi:ran-binding protein 10 [Ephemerocybe angulata]|uniref:Ran-binding protein 10 n=1 Tax=Ephemerocybe angulata TaxID=980116 RepID=A0A8H6IK15_9AGAR|nr:ran-binding protein 10 [Tulosesus angulatus]